MRVIIAAAAVAILASSAAHAVIIKNGSFEKGQAGIGGFISIGAGSTALTDWTIGDGGVDVIGSYWMASEGNRSVDLTAIDVGSISQDIATEIGRTYTVRFDLAGNPVSNGGSPIKSLDVSINGGAPANYLFDTSGNSTAAMGWLPQTYRFVATSTTSTLKFTSLSGFATGPAIDNVSIAVPESATWAMLIAGFSLVGIAARRRRVAAAA